MKLKSLAVLTILVLGCSVGYAQTFGFESVGHGLYCNYETLQQLTPYSVWQGVDNLSACGLPYNATVVGQTTNLPTPGNPAGFDVNGVAYADNIYDAEFEYFSGAQWEVVSGVSCPPKRYAWIGFASVSGFIFGDNYGYLSCSIPGKNGAVATKGMSTGSASKVPARKQ